LVLCFPEPQPPKTVVIVSPVLGAQWGIWGVGRVALIRFVLDQGDDHAVQVEEEHEQVETQLHE
jgi:hypothetical protein